MTPKEQAYELYHAMGFSTYTTVNTQIGKSEPVHRNQYAKDCALIAVEEIKKQLLENLDNDMSTIHAIYWEKVKQEIENL